MWGLRGSRKCQWCILSSNRPRPAPLVRPGRALTCDEASEAGRCDCRRGQRAASGLFCYAESSARDADLAHRHSDLQIAGWLSFAKDADCGRLRCF